MSLNMVVVQLPNRGLLIHSPIKGGDAAYRAVDELGTPVLLVAPNNFHHLSLPAYREHYPNAVAAASSHAIPRLVRKGHLALKPLEETQSMLPPGAHWLFPPGTRTGEAFLSFESGGVRTWVVCDAWFNTQGPYSKLMGALIRLLQVGPGFQISHTYRWLALKDVAAYRDWTLRTIEAEKPNRVVFSHGPAIEGADVPTRLTDSLLSRLGS